MSKQPLKFLRTVAIEAATACRIRHGPKHALYRREHPFGDDGLANSRASGTDRPG